MEEIKYMCKYETVILIKPSLDEKEIEQVKIDVENKTFGDKTKLKHAYLQI